MQFGKHFENYIVKILPMLSSGQQVSMMYCGTQVYIAYMPMSCYITVFICLWVVLVIQIDAMVLPINATGIDLRDRGHCGFNLVLLFMFLMWEVNVIAWYCNLTKCMAWLRRTSLESKKKESLTSCRQQAITWNILMKIIVTLLCYLETMCWSQLDFCCFEIRDHLSKLSC